MSDRASAPRIGLFGGSFDPVHLAHLALARLALETLALDRLVWIPTGHAWQKERTTTAAADREAMVRLAIAGEPRFELSRIELERAGPSYTVDTVRALRAARPGVAEWFLLIGQDQYDRFETWHDWRALLGWVTLAVAGRGARAGTPGDPDLPDELRRAPHAVVPLPPMPLSSTEIRERAARGLPLDGLVPPEVAGYIAAHRLYAFPPPAGVRPAA